MAAVPSLAPASAKMSSRPERRVEAESTGVKPGKTPGVIEIEPDESEFGKILKRPGQ
jgi:hypothetical protein